MKRKSIIHNGLALSCMAIGASCFAPSSSRNNQNQKCNNNNYPPPPQRNPITAMDYSIMDSLKIIDKPPELYALDYVDANDYAVYDLWEDAPRQVTSFEMWAKNVGIQRSDGFKLIEERKGKEVYAATVHDVSAGQPLLYVPEHLILSSTKAMAELRSEQMAPAEQFIIQQGGESEYRQWYLMLKLLKEIQNGRDSPWYPWLNSLPRYFENAPAMTDYCLQCLPPLMRKMAEEERTTCQRLSKDSIASVPFLCDDLKYHPRDFTEWAYQIVYTRAVETDDGDLKLIPMADYFNHGSDYTEIAPAQFDEHGNYYAVTTYDVPAGSKLRISYADPRNPAHLLARYGFFEEECSPSSYCKLLPPTVNQDMLDLGYSHDRMLFYRTGEVADEVWDILLYLHLSSTNLDEQQLLMNAHRQNDFQTKLALHEKHYSTTSAALLQHVDGILEEIDKVIRKSDAHPTYIKNEHRRLPLIHKHNKFVRETFDNVRARYAPEFSEEYSSSNNAASTMDLDGATHAIVQECDDAECALAECVRDRPGVEWNCEGGLGQNADGSQRQTMQTVLAAE